MDDSKIEAAAKAMFERQRQKLTVPLEWRQLSPRTRESYCDDARVAIDVLAPAVNATEAIARLREALEPFAKLNVTRFMVDGCRYDFRVDAAWIRGARAALACHPQEERS